MDRIEQLKAVITKCDALKDTLIPDWNDSVSYRRGKPFKDSSDRDRVYVNLDWPYVRAKIASLWAATPEARLKSRHPQFDKALGPFQKILNETIRSAGTDAARAAVMSDAVNKAGFGVVMISHDTIDSEGEVAVVDI